ncbi:MAG: hypothetical protein ABIW76_06690 [Fibrobacteria bacterium]
MRLRPFWTGWAAYAFVYFALGFRPGVIRSDDFGYLRSIIGTLERGRPYVYDWLEPFGAVFSGACALLYQATGHFLWSTWGFQAGCALALYPLLHRLVSRRMAEGPAVLTVLSLVTFPIFFAKAADFHAGICTLVLFLAALILAESGKWLWFFPAAFLAFANRQNHASLMLLPAWAAGIHWYRTRKVPWPLLAGMGAFVAAASMLMLGMNRSYASLNAGFLHADPIDSAGRGLLALVAGTYMVLGCLSMAALLTGARKPDLRRWVLPLAASVAMLALVPFWHDSLIRTDTPLFGLLAWPQVNRILPWLLLPSLWLLDFRLLRPSPHVLLTAGYIFIASLRGIWWDYYFLELSILCLLIALAGVTNSLPWAGFPRRPGVPEEGAEARFHFPPSRIALTRPVRASLYLLLAGNLGYAYLLKVQTDKQALAVRTMERLEREGRVTEAAMTGATFGYLGWKLFDWFTAHEGRDFGDLADFMGYVRRDRVVIETGVPWRKGFKHALPATAVPIESGICRVGFVSVDYRVADLHGPEAGIPIMGRPMTLDTARYRPPRYPLDDAEWRVFLQNRAKSRLRGGGFAE